MQRGFTLIELIIVIVILGILSIVALPKFVDLSDDANIATTRAETAAFQSAIALVRNAYLIRGTSPVQVAGASVAIDSVSKWPTGTGSGAQLCINLWNSVLVDPQPVAAVSNPNSNLPDGWNVFATSQICAFGKSYGGKTFASGDLPHFIYYIRDMNSFTFNGQTYAGSAGDIQKINM